VNAPPRARILAIMEAASVTGPAKNLIGFCRWLRTTEGEATGLTVAIATFDRNARADQHDSFAGAARAAGIETYVVHERHRFDLGVIPQLLEVATSARANLIQTHNSKSHLLVRSTPALRAGRPWFVFQHGDTYTDLKQRLYNQVDRLTLRAADRVISVCQAFTPRLLGCGVRTDRIRILHNAAGGMREVSTAEQIALREQLGIRAGEAAILSIGRLSREKGHADLLRALARLPAAGKDWKLVLVGVGPEQAELMRLTQALGLNARVVFAGFKADVAPFLAIADIMALPSHTEGSSNVLLEAMAAGVPTVATRVGGNPEIVLSDRTGLLVPVADSLAMATAISRLLNEPGFAAQLAQAACVRAAVEFSFERYRRRLCGYYAEALGIQSESAQLAPLQ
jgi:glycosyltransferase involved in cell wall biosynthesis